MEGSLNHSAALVEASRVGAIGAAIAETIVAAFRDSGVVAAGTEGWSMTTFRSLACAFAVHLRYSHDTEFAPVLLGISGFENKSFVIVTCMTT